MLSVFLFFVRLNACSILLSGWFSDPFELTENVVDARPVYKSSEYFLFHTHEKKSGDAFWVVSSVLGDKSQAVASIASWAMRPDWASMVSPNSRWHHSEGLKVDTTDQPTVTCEGLDSSIFIESKTAQKVTGFYFPTTKMHNETPVLEHTLKSETLYLYWIPEGKKGSWYISPIIGQSVSQDPDKEDSVMAWVKSRNNHFRSGVHDWNVKSSGSWSMDHEVLVVTPRKGKSAFERLQHDRQHYHSFDFQLKNGLHIPYLGLGTLHGSRDIIKHAWYMGYGLYDTTSGYPSEEILGELLHTDHSFRRDNIFLSSKILVLEELGFEQTLREVRKSLWRMDTDYIDMFSLRLATCSSPEEGVITPDLGKFSDVACPTPRGANLTPAWRALEKLYSEGVLMSLGLSNAAVDDIEAVNAFAAAPVMAVLNRYDLTRSPFDESSNQTPSKAMLEYCKNNGIFFQAHSVLSPLYPPTGTKRATKELNDIFHRAAVVAKTFKMKSATAPTVLLRFLQQRNIGVLVASSNIIHLEENLKLYSFELSQLDIAVLAFEEPLEKIYFYHDEL